MGAWKASVQVSNTGVRVMKTTQHRCRRDFAQLGTVALVESSRDTLTDTLMRPGMVIVRDKFDDEAM